MTPPGTALIDPLELVDWADHAVAARGADDARDEHQHTPAGEDALISNSSELASIANTEALTEFDAALQRLRDKARRHLELVDGTPDEPEKPSPAPAAPLVPDVVGASRQRARYRDAMPNLSDVELDEYVKVFSGSLAPATVRSYEGLLAPFYATAAEQGLHPLKCDPSHIEAHLLRLMTEGKRDRHGVPNPDNPYSITYFKTFLAALRRAASAAGLPDPTGKVDIDTLIRGYNRTRGSQLPREGKTEVLPEQLVDIERNSRHGATLRAATLRGIVALGCDATLDLTLSELSNLTFADVDLPRHHDTAMAITTRRRGVARRVEIPANPNDPACAVAAVQNLHDATRRTKRADHNGTAPTKAQLDAQHLFANERTGEPLTCPGLKHIAAAAYTGLACVPQTRSGTTSGPAGRPAPPIGHRGQRCHHRPRSRAHLPHRVLLIEG